jgi:ABC-type bacteriocin/lantibiotic exporter with double-glycine peptidase domain
MKRLPRLRTRVTPVLQMESAECGVACLTMVLGYHGCWTPLGQVRELCGTSRDGNSAFTLLQGARSLGLEARGAKVEPSQLSLLHLPAILHWDLNHFVVLERVHKAGVTIVDPAIGRRFVGSDEVDRCFTGVALNLKPGKAFRRRKRQSLSYGRYRSALFRAKHKLALVLFGNLTSQLLALTFPAASQFLIDQVVLPGRRQWFAPVLVVMALGGVGQVILAMIQRKSQALLHATLGLELTSELGRRLLALPLPFLESRSQGDLMSRVQLQGSLQSLISRIVQAVFDVLLLGLLTALMLAYHLRLGLLALSLMALRIVIVRRFRAVSEHNFSAELSARGREQSAFIEATTSPEAVRGLNLEESVAERYEARMIERAGLTIRSQLLEKRLTSWLTILGGLMQASVLWYGGQYVIRGEMSVGVFAGFLAIRELLEAPLGSIVSLFESLIELRGAFERSDEVFNVAPDRLGERAAAKVRGHIELRNVGFRYGSGGAWVLRNVNMTVEAGEHVVIVGSSGGGKSTLGKLICGILRPTEGEVLLDGHPVTSYDGTSLAAQLGVVLQEPLILAGTVADALRIRLPDATPEMIERAAELAEFLPVVKGMAKGAETKLLARGANLSGGERQRLALAQAYVGEPAVLLLDEATCALDPQTEGRILDRLDRLPTTIISIAHQQNVIARAPRVLQVDDGAVTERNTRWPQPSVSVVQRHVEAREEI